MATETYAVTVSYGPEHAGSYTRLYASKLTGTPAVLPVAAVNYEKWALQSDGFVLVGDGFLDEKGKITFKWDDDSSHVIGRIQAAVNLVGGWRLSAPLNYGDPPIPPVPHPAEGTGGTWFDVDSTSIWDDQDGTDPAELTEAEAVTRVDTNEQHASSNFLYAATNMRYSPVTHATPNGRPSVYCITDTFSPLAYYYSAPFTPVTASGEMSGRPFGRVIVAKRISSTDNVTICNIGSNRPMNSRTNGATGITAYGFVSGFTQALASSWGAGDWAVLAYRWVEGTTELEVSINGGAWQATTGGDGTWTPDAGSITLMGGNMAVAFDWIFDGDPDGLVGHADIAAFIAAIKTWYGI